MTNRVLANDFDDDWNVTLLFGELDPHTRSFRYASAGHPTGYVVSSSGRVKGDLLSTGLPLGILPEANFGVSTPVHLEVGDIVFLYTDGIIDAWSSEGTQLGCERALDVVCANRHQRASDIVESLYQAIRNHTKDEPQLDDMTMIVIKVLSG